MSLEVVAKVERIGGRISLEGDRLKVCIPENYPEAKALVEELRARKPEVLELLRERQGRSLAPCGSPRCAGCYEVELGRRIHPSKASREWLDWLKRWEPKGRAQ